MFEINYYMKEIVAVKKKFRSHEFTKRKYGTFINEFTSFNRSIGCYF